MPRRDIYHAIVVEALIADGWTITADPLSVSYGGRDLYVDLGAERPIGAEKQGEKIAVEIKSFVGPSDVHELTIALGQFVLYRDLLAVIEPDRLLYLAVPQRIAVGILAEPFGQLILMRQQLRVVVFDEAGGGIVSWMP